MFYKVMKNRKKDLKNSKGITYPARPERIITEAGLFRGLGKEGFLTIRDASSFLGVTSQTMRNWDKSKKLKPYRHPLNNYRMYKMIELEKLLKKVRKI